MCGICGIVSFDPTACVSGETLKEMCDLIRHRGPDEEGFFQASVVGLGMRRLSIIDLSGGHQPVYNETSTACVQTFDVPIGKWLTSDLREMTLDLVAHGRVGGEQVFNPEHIMGEMWHGLETGRPGYARQLWSLLNLALWVRQFGVRFA